MSLKSVVLLSSMYCRCRVGVLVGALPLLKEVEVGLDCM